jgi:hypothetical protein
MRPGGRGGTLEPLDHSPLLGRAHPPPIRDLVDRAEAALADIAVI